MVLELGRVRGEVEIGAVDGLKPYDSEEAEPLEDRGRHTLCSCSQTQGR